VIEDLERRMREAAADLEFETAARLRDEIKRLRETELAIADDPLARQADVEDKAGGFQGQRKYGEKANLPSQRKAPSPRPSPRLGEAKLRLDGGREQERAGPLSRHAEGVPPARLGEAQSLPRTGSGGEGERRSRIKDPAVEYPGPRPENPVPRREGGASRIATEYEPVQPTYAQSASRPAAGSRARKPSLDDTVASSSRAEKASLSASGPSPRVAKPTLDDMGPGTDRPVPARDPKIDPRAKAGAFGEGVRGPHKPTLDEMGPHASLPVPKGAKAPPQKPSLPTRTFEFDDPVERKGRKGRPRKTGRPGR
jgi:excinuclease ABC subunit B